MSESLVQGADMPDFSIPTYEEQVQALHEIQARHSRRIGGMALDTTAYRLLSHQEVRRVSVPDTMMRGFAYVRMAPSAPMTYASVTEFGICLQAAFSPRFDMPHASMPKAFVPVLDRRPDGTITTAARWDTIRPFSADGEDAVRQMGEELECAKVFGTIRNLNFTSGTDISRLV